MYKHMQNNRLSEPRNDTAHQEMFKLEDIATLLCHQWHQDTHCRAVYRTDSLRPSHHSLPVSISLMVNTWCLLDSVCVFLWIEVISLPVANFVQLISYFKSLLIQYKIYTITLIVYVCSQQNHTLKIVLLPPDAPVTIYRPVAKIFRRVVSDVYECMQD